MTSFKDYIHKKASAQFLTEMSNDVAIDAELISEAMIMLTNASKANFGNVVVLAGGSGSGKGWVLDNLIQIEGKVLDVDALKTAAMKSKLITNRVRDEFGVELTKLNLKNTDDVARLHLIINDAINLPDRKQQALFASILTAAPDRKPNLIFDVTLKDLQKLQNISIYARDLGYDQKNIHIVWVCNDITVASEQNQKRSRTVPEEILINTHKGVSMTMKDILGMGDKLKSYMDGAVVIAFNKAGIDTKVVSGGTNAKGKKVSYIEKANYVFAKKPGQAATAPDNLAEEVLAKIRSYVPKDERGW